MNNYEIYKKGKEVERVESDAKVKDNGRPGIFFWVVWYMVKVNRFNDKFKSLKNSSKGFLKPCGCNLTCVLTLGSAPGQSI